MSVPFMKRPAILLVALIFLVLLAVSAASAREYIVRPGSENPVPEGAAARTPVEVAFIELPLWVMLAQFVLLPPELLLALKIWGYLGFRRISGGNVLDHEIRARIYDHIQKNPGIHLRGLAGEMGMSLGTLRYHLNLLRLTHKIAVSEDPASVRFYENNGTYTTAEQHLHKHLRNETTKKILAALLNCPTASRLDIARKVGVTGPSVTWHIKRLEEDRLVITRRQGRSIVYEIPAPIVGCLERQIRPSPSASA